MDIVVENIKCGGCANSISKKLHESFGSKNINVDVETGVVSIDIDESRKPEVAEVLLNLGYPESDSIHGFDSAKAKAKSFVSCAIGRMDK